MVGVDDLHKLDLVELMHADDALVVSSGGSRLAPETGGVGRHFDRQVGFRQKRVAVEIGDRHLGGGGEENAIDAVFSGIGAIHVVLEFRELAGAFHALALDEVRDVDLLVAVGGLRI